MSAIVSTRTEPSDRVIVRWLVPSSCLAVVSVSTLRSSAMVPDSGSALLSAASLTVPSVPDAAVSVLPVSVREGTWPVPPFPS